MLRKEDFAVIKALKKRDVYLKDIAAELGVHPKTVSRALQRRSAPSVTGRPVASTLSPYPRQEARGSQHRALGGVSHREEWRHLAPPNESAIVSTAP
jgi:IS30 family transposase